MRWIFFFFKRSLRVMCEFREDLSARSLLVRWKTLSLRSVAVSASRQAFHMVIFSTKDILQDSSCGSSYFEMWTFAHMLGDLR